MSYPASAIPVARILALPERKWRREDISSHRHPPRAEVPENESRSGPLVEEGLDDRCEGVPRPVQPRLHRSEVARRDVGDLLVGLPFELPKHEHLAVMLGQLRY